MARAIAKVGGVLIVPGVSRNRRLYTPDAIARMVDRARKRLEAGEAISLTDRTIAGDGPSQPITTLTHHAAEGDPTRIVGGLTSLAVDQDTGAVRYTADIADTPHGRTIAALADTSDSRPPFLKGVSIRGAWIGKVRKVTGPDGQPAETGDDFELNGLDYTSRPGVPAAGIDTFAWAGDGKRASETTGHVLISESVEEALVTISEQTGDGSDISSSPAAGSLPGDAPALASHVLEDGECVTCAGSIAEAAMALSRRGSGVTGPGGPYADPGYQDDKKQRYQLDTRAHVRAAWSYINMPRNARKYTAAQLKRIKSRITAAMRKLGIKTTSEGWVIDPAVRITEQIAERYGDPSTCGSWSISASNGPVSLNLSSYSMDPADLDVVLRAAADAACTALRALDPDMDGDIDVAGAPEADTGHDTADSPVRLAVPPLTLAGDESAAGAGTDPAGTTGPETSPAAGSGAGETTEGDPAMPETTTAAESAPAAATFTQDQLDAAVKASLERDRQARKTAKAEARAARKAAGKTETAPAGKDKGSGKVTESEDERIARLVEASVTRALAAGTQAPAAAVQETEEQRIGRLVEERLTEERQKLVAEGTVAAGRRGLVQPVTEAAAAAGGSESLNSHGLPSSWPDKPLHEYTPEERDTYMGPALVRHVLGQRADMLA